LRHDFSMLYVAKVDLDVAGVIFLNVADVAFECCEFLNHVACNMIKCCDKIFFYFSFLVLQ
jgi:hypothetical protein